MSELKALQYEFIDYLLGKKSDIADHIQSTAAMSAQDRLNIYAYAYKARLKEAIMTDYEKLHSYLGDVQFDQVLERYIEKYPSAETNLRYYGIRMAVLLRDEEPFRSLPILAEIAHIEAAFINSFDAKDATSVTIKQLSALAPETWETLNFTLHASVQILTYQFNSFDVWKALADEKPPPEATLNDVPKVWLLWRDAALITRYRSLSADETDALSLVAQGKSFPEVCEQLLSYFEEDEVPLKAVAYLQAWVQEGLIINLDSSDSQS